MFILNLRILPTPAAQLLPWRTSSDWQQLTTPHTSCEDWTPLRCLPCGNMSRHTHALELTKTFPNHYLCNPVCIHELGIMPGHLVNAHNEFLMSDKTKPYLHIFAFLGTSGKITKQNKISLLNKHNTNEEQ